jgi:hypothetical protein
MRTKHVCMYRKRSGRLVRAMAAGDQRALRALYDRTHRLVFTFLVRLLNDRRSAEELTLETLPRCLVSSAQVRSLRRARPGLDHESSVVQGDRPAALRPATEARSASLLRRSFSGSR